MIAGWEGERRAESRRQIDQISDRSKCKLVTLRVNSSVKQNFVSRRLQASAVDAGSQVLAAGNEAADWPTTKASGLIPSERTSRTFVPQ
jgi:hypothetical protein